LRDADDRLESNSDDHARNSDSHQHASNSDGHKYAGYANRHEDAGAANSDKHTGCSPGGKHTADYTTDNILHATAERHPADNKLRPCSAAQSNGDGLEPASGERNPNGKQAANANGRQHPSLGRRFNNYDKQLRARPGRRRLSLRAQRQRDGPV
jgi:hypothetical protein